MHHERSERHVRADRAYPLDDHRERRGRVLLLGKGAVLTQRVAGPLAAELDESEQWPTRRARTLLAAPFHGCGRLRPYAAHARCGRTATVLLGSWLALASFSK